MAKRVSGNHNPDEVLLGIHTSPEFKALVSVIANISGRNLTDTIVEALMRLAQTQGVVDEHLNLKDKFKTMVSEKAKQIRFARKNKSIKKH